MTEDGGGPGRPTKLTPDREERLVKALADGNTRAAACALACISTDSLARWMKADAGFAEAIKKAEADAEEKAVACVRTAALDPKHWTAAAWWLERRRPKQWGKTEKPQTPTGNGGTWVLQFDEAKPPPKKTDG